ncbi:MAG: hypothetical protein ACRDPC_26030 [Solirubrobacteraceae bacterium]
MRRAILLVLVAAAVTGALALSASGREAAPVPKGTDPLGTETQLPPLPEMRGKVVEPVAGDTGADAAPVTDPGLEEVGPRPTRPASAGTPRQRVRGGGTDVAKATALGNGVALPPLEAPEEVKQIIESGNIIARSPYKWGGGHGRWKDNGYDCSGSVSFALAAAGLLEGPLASGPLMQWGEPGRGKWVTIWTNPGHVFMEVAGIRFDTSGRQVTGSRWQNATRSTSGFVARHPAGL